MIKSPQPIQKSPGLSDLLTEIRACRLCDTHLPHGANPILRAHPDARVLIVGQAPGTKVHASGIPWNDPSGDRLRQWMSISKEVFYDEKLFAIIPMGFCYPGKGKSGDLPPRPECATHWRERLHAQLPNIELTLLVGQYAHAYYLKSLRKPTLTETIRAWQEYGPAYLPLVHPSPRNQGWIKRNPWFEAEITPALRGRLAEIYPLTAGRQK